MRVLRLLALVFPLLCVCLREVHGERMQERDESYRSLGAVDILRKVEAGDSHAIRMVRAVGNGALLLHTAVQNGLVNAAKLVLDNGLDVDSQLGHFGSALHTAVTHGQLACIKLLLSGC